MNKDLLKSLYLNLPKEYKTGSPKRDVRNYYRDNSNEYIDLIGLNYSTSNNIHSELNNNLVIIDKIVGTMKLRHIPEFHIVGGSALVFNKLLARATLDIDTGNKICNEVKKELGAFISDDASEVIIKASKYNDRLIEYLDVILLNIEVRIFSPEDLFISKCGTGREKDISDLIALINKGKIDFDKLILIMKNELSSEDYKKVVHTLKFMQSKESNRNEQGTDLFKHDW